MEIKSKKELKDILNYERERWKLPQAHSWVGWLKIKLVFFFHPGSPYQYMYCLRNLEYYQGRGGRKLHKLYYKYKLKVLGLRTGIELYPGVADIGVKPNHGKCIVSRSAKIGRDTIIVGFVTIGGVGGNRDGAGVATIGQRCFISTGVRIIGPVHIADNVVLGANAVVVKDINEPGTYVGVPAHKISDKGSECYIR